MFTFNWDAARKKNVLDVWGALLKLGGSSGIQETVVADLQKSLLSASRRFTKFLQGCRKEEDRLGCEGSFPKVGWKLWEFMTGL